MKPTIFTCAAVLLSAAPALGSCGELSYQRNAIYKRAGYCFKTTEQIRNFGNAGCQYDNQADVPLSARERAEIGSILREERLEGCR